jgi:hypothetical protein
MSRHHVSSPTSIPTGPIAPRRALLPRSGKFRVKLAGMRSIMLAPLAPLLNRVRCHWVPISAVARQAPEPRYADFLPSPMRSVGRGSGLLALCNGHLDR